MTDTTEQSANARYIFVKLTNGENIMCTTFSNIDKLEKLKFLEVIDPIQIFSFKIPHNGNIIEKYIMQNWAPFSTTTTSTIPISNIVFAGDLKELFIEKYIDYITDPNGQQMLEETGADQMSDDEDDEEENMMEDLIEEVIDKTENTKKWYH